jgi:hypothetical protein
LGHQLLFLLDADDKNCSDTANKHAPEQPPRNEQQKQNADPKNAVS